MNLEAPAEKHQAVLQPEEWLNEDLRSLNIEGGPPGVSCMEDLIKREFQGKKGVSVLEVGPIDPYWHRSKDKKQQTSRAPIGVLKERNPDLICLGAGPQKLSEEDRQTVLGVVKFVRALLSPDEEYDDDFASLRDSWEERPDIVYGNHIFENSRASNIDLPQGPYKPFEVSAQILKPGGFLIVDNAPGRSNQIGVRDDWPYSSTLELAYKYVHSKDSGWAIYVFRKTFTDPAVDLVKNFEYTFGPMRKI